MRIVALPALAALAWAPAAAAHHPVGIPQYRQAEGDIVMIYNVMTQDHIVRFQVRPGRPEAPPPCPVELLATIEPKDPAVLFPGGTWLSVAEDAGGGAEREVLPARLESGEAGPRTVRASFAFHRPGSYIVRVEFTESPGQEVLSFPVRVTRSGPGAGGWPLKLLLCAALAAGVLLLARAAAARRRARERAAAPGRRRGPLP